MTNEEFIKLIDDEIAEFNELWDIYYDQGDNEGRKRMASNKLAFEMFRRKVLRKIGGSVN